MVVKSSRGGNKSDPLDVGLFDDALNYTDSPFRWIRARSAWTLRHDDALNFKAGGNLDDHSGRGKDDSDLPGAAGIRNESNKMKVGQVAVSRD